ncbi:MAG: phage protein [Saprospiraceae bacterium]
MNYDPKKFVFSFFGTPIVGYADGTGIEFTRDRDMFTKVVGMQGSGTFVKSNDKSGTFTITLQQSSPSNDQLSAIALLDETANAGVGGVLLKDALGATAISSAEARIMKFPDFTVATDLSNNAWGIACLDVDVFIAGNP